MFKFDKLPSTYKTIISALYNMPTVKSLGGKPIAFTNNSPRITLNGNNVLTSAILALVSPDKPDEADVRLAHLLSEIQGQMCSPETSTTEGYSRGKHWVEIAKGRLALDMQSVRMPDFDLSQTEIEQLLLIATEGAKPIEADVVFLRKAVSALLSHVSHPVQDAILQLESRIPAPVPTEPVGYIIETPKLGSYDREWQQLAVFPLADKAKAWEAFLERKKNNPRLTYRFMAVYPQR